MFGELGIIEDKPRSATIICLSNSYFATLTKEKYDDLLKKSEEFKLSQKYNFFKDYIFGNNIDYKSLKQLALYFHRKRVWKP